MFDGPFSAIWITCIVLLIFGFIAVMRRWQIGHQEEGPQQEVVSYVSQDYNPQYYVRSNQPTPTSSEAQISRPPAVYQPDSYVIDMPPPSYQEYKKDVPLQSFDQPPNPFASSTHHNTT
ncbi:uncharacterized protein BYT42DRAFT_572862 [Radiomyces spectabilis]|uniref:uncharacterized protein n=1 Tax=Radiomyces spectabilis TaxID=64574 RepID=UPI002220BF6F|nr:uncharacterized protein BYT42DRAFT_572862 [Radiomyces spectabilis]KAI8375949.1 hypothetical protein BYT42DRAFT_572862 [Radiomyces spectabilis]